MPASEFPGLGPLIRTGGRAWLHVERAGPWAYLMGPGRPTPDLRGKRCDTVPYPRRCRGCPDCMGIR